MCVSGGFSQSQSHMCMHHHSSGTHTTLQRSGIIRMPSGFSSDTDLQLLDLVKQEKSELAKYVTLVIDEM